MSAILMLFLGGCSFFAIIAIMRLIKGHMDVTKSEIMEMADRWNSRSADSFTEMQEEAGTKSLTKIPFRIKPAGKRKLDIWTFKNQKNPPKC